MDCTADCVVRADEYSPARKASAAERYLLLCAAVLAMASLSLFATVAAQASAHSHALHH